MNLDGRTYPQSVLSIHNKSIDFECLKKSTESKLIVAWNSFYGSIKFSKGFFKECLLKNCKFTMDRTNIEKADLVLVHMLDKFDELPSFENYKRPPHQRWVFSVHESPVHGSDVSKYNGYFNLSHTYKMEATYKGLYEIHQGESFLLEKNPSVISKLHKILISHNSEYRCT